MLEKDSKLNKEEFYNAWVGIGIGFLWAWLEFHFIDSGKMDLLDKAFYWLA